jgi:hypothetical protein
MKISQRVLKDRKAALCRDAFEKAMGKGAEEFGVLWLDSHNAVTQSVMGLGIDYTSPEIKAVMAVTVLHTLYKARRHYIGSPKTLMIGVSQ